MSSSSCGEALRSSVEAAHKLIHTAETTEHATANLAQLIAHDAQLEQNSSSASFLLTNNNASTSTQHATHNNPRITHWHSVLISLLQCAPAHRWCADAALRIVRELCEVRAPKFLALVLSRLDSSLRISDSIWAAVRELALACAADSDNAVRVRAPALLATLVRAIDSHKALSALCDLLERDHFAACREAAMAAVPLVRDAGALDCAIRVACNDQHSSVRSIFYARVTADASTPDTWPVLRMLTVAERRALLESGFRDRNVPVYGECESLLQAWAVCDLERGVRLTAPNVLNALRLLGELSECERLALRVTDVLFGSLQVVPHFHTAPFAIDELLVWRHACSAMSSEKNGDWGETISKMFRMPSVDTFAQVLEAWSSGARSDLFALRQLLMCVAPLVGLGRARLRKPATIADVGENDDDDDGDNGDRRFDASALLRAQQGEQRCRNIVLTILKRPHLFGACDEALIAFWSFDETLNQRLQSLVEVIGQLSDEDEAHDDVDGTVEERLLIATHAALFCMRKCDRRHAITDSLLNLALRAIKNTSPNVRLCGAELLPHFQRVGTTPHEFVVAPLEMLAVTTSDFPSVRAKAFESCLEVYLRKRQELHRPALPFGGDHCSAHDLLSNASSLFDMHMLQYRAVDAPLCSNLMHSVKSGAAVGIQSVLGALLRESSVDLDGTSDAVLKLTVYNALACWPQQDDVSRNAILLLALFDADVQYSQRAAQTQSALHTWVSDRGQLSRIMCDATLVFAVARVLQRSHCFLERSSLLRDAPQASNVEQLVRHMQFVTECSHNAELWLGLADMLKTMTDDDARLVRVLLRCIDITPPQHDDGSFARDQWLHPFLACVDDLGDTELVTYVQSLRGNGASDVPFAVWNDISARKRRELTDALRVKRVSFGGRGGSLLPLSMNNSEPRSPDVFSAPSAARSELTLTTTDGTTLDFDDNAVIVPDTPTNTNDFAQLSSPSSRSSEVGETTTRRLSRASRSRGSLLPTQIVPATIEIVDDDDEAPPTTPRPRRRSRESDTLSPTQVVPRSAPIIEIDDDDEQPPLDNEEAPLLSEKSPSLTSTYVEPLSEEVSQQEVAPANVSPKTPVPVVTAVEPEAPIDDVISADEVPVVVSHEPLVPVAPPVDEVIPVDEVPVVMPTHVSRVTFAATAAVEASPVHPASSVQHPFDGEFDEVRAESLSPVHTQTGQSPVVTQPAVVAMAREPFRQIRVGSDTAQIRFDDLLRPSSNTSVAPSSLTVPMRKSSDEEGDKDGNGDDDDVPNVDTPLLRRAPVVSYKKRAAATATSEQRPLKQACVASALIYYTPAALRQRASDAPSLEAMARVLNVHFLETKQRSRATHVIVDDSNDRTLFTLCAALRHMWLVPSQWLSQSYQACSLLPERFFGSRLVSDPLAERRVWCDPAMLAVGDKHGFPSPHFEVLINCGRGTLVQRASDADLLLVLDGDKALVDDDSQSTAENRHANRGRRVKKANKLAIGTLFDTLQPLAASKQR